LGHDRSLPVGQGIKKSNLSEKPLGRVIKESHKGDIMHTTGGSNKIPGGLAQCLANSLSFGLAGLFQRRWSQFQADRNFRLAIEVRKQWVITERRRRYQALGLPVPA
jgi:hypothetical protein